jgi:diketogulonate reductase-like aldo/keto reductase
MRFKNLGNTGEKIPEIGLGTWKMGSDPQKDKEAIRTAIKLKMKFIDTAEMYGSEWIVGNAIKGEKGIFVATKVSPNHFHYDDVIRSCNNSLKNLNLKQIDLYQLHWPNHSIQIGETMRAMEKLVDTGKIGHIGVSNFNIKEFEEAQSSLSKYDIVSNQVEYSILVRDAEKEMLDYCNKNKITLIAYSPLATGAIFYPKNRNLLEALDSVGKAHKKTATQVALNWLLSKKSVVVIPKTSRKEHVMEIAGSSGWRLTKGEMAQLNSLKERRGSLAGALVFAPILKSNGAWAGIANSLPKKRPKSHSNSKTTKSSKK